LVCLALLVVSAHGLSLRTRRAPLVPAVVEEQSSAKPEMVMAELTSEADSIIEDGSNDESAAADAENGRSVEADADASSEEVSAEAEAETEGEAAEGEAIHAHFRRFTKPMELLPADHTTLVEVDTSASVAADDEGGEDKGSNPTYILPVDPFNYFPFFNGFSNVNPFSQFYPPPPYLYPQYTNYMHQYANHGVGHPPAYPTPGNYGFGGHGHGGGGAFNFGGVMGHGHAGFPNNYGGPHPHMHYPFGAYKMDVSGPDVRTGSNNPPPFPQFTEVSSTLIAPEMIPVDKDATTDAEFVAAVEVEAAATSDDEGAEDVEFESDAADSDEFSSNVEFEEAGADEEAGGFENVVDFEDEAEGSDMAEVEYA